MSSIDIRTSARNRELPFARREKQMQRLVTACVVARPVIQI